MLFVEAMKFLNTLLVCIVAFFLISTQVKPVKGGDFTCTVCVIVIDIIQTELKEHPQDIQTFIEDKLCTYLPESYQPMCKFIVKNFEPILIDLLQKQASPSRVCNAVKYFNCNGCSMDQNMNGLPDETMDKLHRLAFFHTLNAERKKSVVPLSMTGMSSREVVSNLASLKSGKSPNSQGELIPKLDLDTDYFSPVHSMIRGANWRGQDCNDANPDVRPGLLSDRNSSEDTNCNGIKGADKNGYLYEEIFCHTQEAAKSSLKTVVMFGDSASSHFHIPEEWFQIQNITKLLSGLDEFDWPQLSWGTGFDDSINGDSIYLKLRKMNLCNHRGYINVGHNGHRAADLVDQVAALSHHKDEKPYLAFLAYIGNDVCKPSIDRITTNEDFKKQITDGLFKLDSQAPAGSKLLAMGLVDGRILWDEMHNKTHPLGVPYSSVYAFLSCTGANPCNTWLSSDKEKRDYTSQRAAELSTVLKNTVLGLKGQLKNLDLDYTDFPLQPALNYAKSIGLPASVMIEKVDGFHPSDFGHRYFAKYLWEFLQKNHPDWLGVENHYNSNIVNMFGDQGGH